MAVEIALHCGSTKDVVKELAERIGSGPAISETVPAALGILIANQGLSLIHILLIFTKLVNMLERRLRSSDH